MDEGSTTMSFDGFFESMFELCDTWTDGSHEDEYVEIAEEMMAAHQDYLATQARRTKVRGGGDVVTDMTLAQNSNGNARAAGAKRGSGLVLELQDGEENHEEKTEGGEMKAEEKEQEQEGESKGGTKGGSEEESGEECKEVDLASASDVDAPARKSAQGGSRTSSPGANRSRRMEIGGAVAVAASSTGGNAHALDRKCELPASASDVHGATARESKPVRGMTAGLGESGQAVVMSGVSGLDSEQQNQLLPSTSGLSTAGQEALAGPMLSLSTTDQAAMTNVPSNLDEDQAEQLLNLSAGLGDAEKGATVLAVKGLDETAMAATLTAMDGLSAESKQSFVAALGKQGSEERAKLTLIMGGLRANEKQDFLARMVEYGGVWWSTMTPEDIRTLMLAERQPSKRIGEAVPQFGHVRTCTYSYCTCCNTGFVAPYLRVAAAGFIAPTTPRSRPEQERRQRHCGECSKPKILPTALRHRVRPVVIKERIRARRRVDDAKAASTAAIKVALAAAEAAREVLATLRWFECSSIYQDQVVSAYVSLADGTRSSPITPLPYDSTNQQEEAGGLPLVVKAMSIPTLGSRSASPQQSTQQTLKTNSGSSDEAAKKLVEIWMKFPDFVVDPVLLLPQCSQDAGSSSGSSGSSGSSRRNSRSMQSGGHRQRARDDSERCGAGHSGGRCSTAPSGMSARKKHGYPSSTARSSKSAGTMTMTDKYGALSSRAARRAEFNSHNSARRAEFNSRRTGTPLPLFPGKRRLTELQEQRQRTSNSTHVRGRAGRARTALLRPFLPAL
jgi:hypothetical protein